jgi:hypothetical protein
VLTAGNSARAFRRLDRLISFGGGFGDGRRNGAESQGGEDQGVDAEGKHLVILCLVVKDVKFGR